MLTPAASFPIRGDGYTDRLSLDGRPALPDAALSAAREAGRVVEDRSFYAQLAGSRTSKGQPPLGHGWSAAAFTPYRLLAGSPPSGTDEVVLAGAPRDMVGRQVSVLTVAGPASYRVSGVTAATSFEQAIFFSDDRAAELSPPINAAVVYGSADKLRPSIARTNRDQPDRLPEVVLTGNARHDADPGRADERLALRSVTGLLGVTGGLAAVVTIFLVGATFAFSVNQRQRELALLRLAGGTPQQIRTMVLAEAALIGLAAATLGALIGLVGGPLLARWLVTRQVAPDWFQVRLTPLVLVALVGVLLTGVCVALVGAALACLRAGRIRPIEALRQSQVSRTGMGLARWMLGLFTLLLGVALLWLVPLADPLVAIGLNQGFAVVLVVAVALLAPLAIRPVTQLATLPLVLGRGATGLLVRQTTFASVRRAAATAVPVIITLGLASALLGSLATLNAAKSHELNRSLASQFTVLSRTGPGLDQSVVDRVAELPGVTSEPVRQVQLYGPQRGSTGLVQYQAQAVQPSALTTLFDLQVVAGSVTALNDSTMLIDQEWGKKVGDKVPVIFGDGTRGQLTVAAVLRTGFGNNSAFVTPSHAGQLLADRIDVRGPAGLNAAVIASAINRPDVTVLATTEWSRATDRHQIEHSRQNATTVLAIVLLYSVLATANTIAMATAARGREFAALRLAGAGRWRIALISTIESLLAVLVGGLLAAIATAISLVGLRDAIRHVTDSSRITIEWAMLASLTGVIAVIAMLSTVIPCLLVMRARPIQLVGNRE
ncbi:ABC transporter permease [Frankia canadensis]|uniref:ABC transporter permease n=1 Tax=Frankia canadensis TaxID=1836972 RepID=UPI001056757E|nr:FtsX-like permease family protein [Frankia canadensis]